MQAHDPRNQRTNGSGRPSQIIKWMPLTSQTNSYTIRNQDKKNYVIMNGVTSRVTEMLQFEMLKQIHSEHSIDFSMSELMMSTKHYL